MDKYKFTSRPQANPKAIVSGPNYRFTILTDRLIRYEWAEDGQFEDRASTFAINRDLPVPDFKVIDKDDLEIITKHFHLSYDKKRFSPGGFLVESNAKATDWGAPWRFGLPADLNLGGTTRTLDNVNGRCDVEDGVLSKAGFAAIDDSKAMLFDGKGFVTNRPDGDRVDGYLFCYGRDYKACIKALYTVSGKQPVVPRFALGNWWSRYYAYQQDEYLQLMDKFRENDIPMSVAVVDMDWHLVSDERVPHAGWTGYTWDKKLFPDPKAFGQELHNRNLKITLNDHPHSGIHSHEEIYQELAEYLGRDTKDKAPILFNPTDPKFMDAYLNIVHRSVEKIACDFWWLDWQQGPFSKVPGIDPLWMLNHFQYVDDQREGKEPLIFSRYAGPGSHRYPVGFSGDTFVTWDSLKFQPEFTATASNIGYGWWSHDIGGHLFGARDDELVTRWFQFGVFSPIMRLHSCNSRWMSKEPWLYGKEYETVMAEYMRIRHRLVPFLYTRNIICSAKDEPLVQPLYWSYPNREEAYSFPNQYFFGDELMVAPIVQPRDKRTALGSVKAWFPPGTRHVDIYNGTVYDGDRELTLHRGIDEYPVLAHEGSIIPLDGDSAPRNGCVNPTSFYVLVVVGQDGSGKVIEDSSDNSSDDKPRNGSNSRRESAINFTQPSTIQDDKVVSLDDAQQGGNSERREATINFNQAEGKLTANVTGRTWTFCFLSITEIPKNLRVFVDGTDRTKDAPVVVQNNPQTPSLVVRCPPSEQEKSEIVIELGKDPQLSIIDHIPRIEKILMDYQTEFHLKDRLWEIVGDLKSKPVSSVVGKLLSLGYDEALVGPVAELLLADSRNCRS